MFKTITDAQLDEAQEILGFEFPDEYTEFIKSGYDPGDAPIEALDILDPPSFANIFETLKMLASITIYQRNYYPYAKITLTITV
ncbi:SMI1/KNR4 family protein [Vibrio mediterranei]|uniref:SMI1/KNR4 family protein n=1 Tax=Vibrio mediterranei TaxID=689 RepID=UPI001F5BDB71|nr:SMI1/KNR4 family protein [Vibrio mediterranei]